MHYARPYAWPLFVGAVTTLSLSRAGGRILRNIMSEVTRGHLCRSFDYAASLPDGAHSLQMIPTKMCLCLLVVCEVSAKVAQTSCQTTGLHKISKYSFSNLALLNESFKHKAKQSAQSEASNKYHPEQ